MVAKDGNDPSTFALSRRCSTTELHGYIGSPGWARTTAEKCMAGKPGLEPGTFRLTAERSTN